MTQAHINFQRSGGFAGITLRTSTVLDEEQTKQLTLILDELKSFNSPPQPDRFSYDLDIIIGNDHHTVQFGDSDTPSALRPLLDELVRKAREISYPVDNSDKGYQFRQN